jgi:hypothetical protein
MPRPSTLNYFTDPKISMTTSGNVSAIAAQQTISAFNPFENSDPVLNGATLECSYDQASGRWLIVSVEC